MKKSFHNNKKYIKYFNENNNDTFRVLFEILFIRNAHETLIQIYSISNVSLKKLL